MLHTRLHRLKSEECFILNFIARSRKNDMRCRTQWCFGQGFPFVGAGCSASFLWIVLGYPQMHYPRVIRALTKTRSCRDGITSPMRELSISFNLMVSIWWTSGDLGLAGFCYLWSRLFSILNVSSQLFLFRTRLVVRFDSPFFSNTFFFPSRVSPLRFKSRKNDLLTNLLTRPFEGLF